VAVFAALTRVAEARFRRVGRRLGLRLTLMALCLLAGLVFLLFALAAATTALAVRVGLLDALGIMAAGALIVCVILLAILALEARRHRRDAARQQALDRRLYRAAALAAVPGRLPSRPAAGLALVALGAFLVLMRRDRDED
jgi:hypothetical protein